MAGARKTGSLTHNTRSRGFMQPIQTTRQNAQGHYNDGMDDEYVHIYVHCMAEGSFMGMLSRTFL
jgi:hypothetical protein